MLIKSGENISTLISLIMLHEENIKSMRREAYDIQFIIGRDIDRETSDFSNNVTYTTFNDLDVQSELSCPITHEPFQSSDPVVLINHCQHYFKKDAFLTWALRSNRCPCCRHDFTE